MIEVSFLNVHVFKGHHGQFYSEESRTLKVGIQLTGIPMGIVEQNMSDKYHKVKQWSRTDRQMCFLFGLNDVRRVVVTSLTLSQWSSSGFPVAIQCAWNSDPSVHWNATGEMPVCFQWCSSGVPVAFQWSSSVFQLCKLTLDRHWNTTGR